MKSANKILILAFGIAFSLFFDSSLFAMKNCLGGSCKADETSTSSSEDESPKMRQEKLRRAKSEKSMYDGQYTVPNQSKITDINQIRKSKLMILANQQTRSDNQQKISDSQKKIEESHERQLDRYNHPEQHDLRSEIRLMKSSPNNSNPARLNKKVSKSAEELSQSAPTVSAHKKQKKLHELMASTGVTLKKIEKALGEDFNNPESLKTLLNSSDKEANTPVIKVTRIIAEQATKTKRTDPRWKNYVAIYQWFNSHSAIINWDHYNQNKQSAKDILTEYDEKDKEVILPLFHAVINNGSFSQSQEALEGQNRLPKAFELDQIEKQIEKERKEEEKKRKTLNKATQHRKSKSLDEF